MIRKLVLVALFSGLLLTGRVSAVSAAQGFYLGGDILYSMIAGDFNGVDGPEADPGAGFGLVVGYGFTPAFSFQIDWNATVHDSQVVTGDPTSDGGFGAFILGFKLSFQVDQPFQPFLHLGWGSFAFVMDDPAIGDVELTGTGFDIGIGADYYTNPNFSFGFGVSRRFIDYDELKIFGNTGSLSPEVKGDSTTIDLNFVYHFGAGWTGGSSEF